MSNYQTQFSGVISKNSIDYVRQIFKLNSARKPVLLLRTESDERLKQFSVEEVYTPGDECGWASLTFDPINNDEVAQVSFTSGTEGEPKGIVLTYANQYDAIARLQQVMNVDASIREYVGIPVFHSFGFGRCRLVSSVGGQFFIPANGFDCFEIQSMLQAGEINAISAVPSLWRILLQSQEIFGEERRTLRWIEIGSQYMSSDEKRSLKTLFPNATIVQHYGLTEASRATFLAISETDSDVALESVGKVVGDTQVRLGPDGAIEIKGSVVAKEMLLRGEVHALVNQDGWLSTNDLGEFVGDYLYYRGRKDDMINCGGIKLYAEAIEKELRAELGVASGIACTKFAHELRGDGLLVVYEPKVTATKDEIVAAADRVLHQKGISARGALRVEPIAQLPMTATGKVQRNKIPELLVASVPHHQSAYERHSDGEYAELKALWCQILGLDDASIDESFNDLGGDSLTAISAIFKMKKIGVPDETARAILQGATIREIVDQGKTRDSIKTSNLKCDTALQIKVVRGLLVLIVIAAHWSFGFFEHLPSSFDAVKVVLAPIFAAGTPGFAIMYGVAIGYSFLPLYLQSPQRLSKLIKPIAWVLFAGILAQGGLNIGVMLTGEEPMSLTRFFNAFYGVLTYYLLITLTLPAVFFVITRWLPIMLAASLGALLLHLLYLVVFEPLRHVAAEGVVEFGKLLLAGKYSYINMTSGVLLGITVGFGLHQKIVTSRKLLMLSGALFAIAILLSFASGATDEWLQWPTSRVPAWRWLLYTGVGLSIMWVIHWMDRFNSKAVVTVPLKLLGTIGMLAFPFYVMHELVLPTKSLLSSLGVASSVSLVLPMVAFFACAIYMIVKSKRLLFS